MAHVDSIWFHGDHLTKDTMKVYVKLKPSGSVNIEVPIPLKFHEAIVDMAQLAADAHEQAMRLEIMGDELHELKEEK